MKTNVLPDLGSLFGPCLDEGCEHAHCKKIREVANSECSVCGEPIGYGNPFYANENNERIHVDCKKDENGEEGRFCSVCGESIEFGETFYLQGDDKVCYCCKHGLDKRMKIKDHQEYIAISKDKVSRSYYQFKVIEDTGSETKTHSFYVEFRPSTLREYDNPFEALINQAEVFVEENLISAGSKYTIEIDPRFKERLEKLVEKYNLEVA